MNQTIVLVRYTAQPGKAPEALEKIRQLVATVIATEPECAGIDVLQDLDTPESITLVERWPDKATFLGPHTQTPHIQDFIRGAGAFLAGPPQLSFHSVSRVG